MYRLNTQPLFYYICQGQPVSLAMLSSTLLGWGILCSEPHQLRCGLLCSLCTPVHKIVLYSICDMCNCVIKILRNTSLFYPGNSNIITHNSQSQDILMATRIKFYFKQCCIMSATKDMAKHSDTRRGNTPPLFTVLIALAYSMAKAESYIVCELE